MGPVAGQVGVEVASAIVTEAVEEVLGNSRRKWAVLLLAIVLGVVVAGIVKKRRESQDVVEREEPAFR